MKHLLPGSLLSCALLVACGGGGEATAASGSAAASSSGAAASAAPLPAWVGIPQSPAIEAFANRTPYAGPTGTLKGRVTIKGDPPPDGDAANYTPDCAEAAGVYSKAFRVGQDNAAADVLVAVTGYDAFVPPAAPVVKATARGCSFDKRTYALAFGQRLEVVNDDKKGSYTPILDGADYRAVMMSVPYGDPVKLYPGRPAINYVLRDLQARPYMVADVLVLKFSTIDVTGLDGHYEIPRIPVGKVKVNLLLPTIGKTLGEEGRSIEIKEGENTLDLEIAYDAKTDNIVPRPPSPFARGSKDEPAASAGRFGGPPPSDVPR